MFGTLIILVIGAFLVAAVALWIVGERGRLLRSSTWRFMREAGIKPMLNFSALHAYVYGRWIKQYIDVLINFIVPRLGPNGKRWLSDHYHGKVLTPDLARAVITLDKDIPLRDLEQIIPYPMARNLVLTGPPDVAVFQCGCRQIREKPCEPVEVCMVIGQPFVDFILEHHPKTSRRLTQGDALALLKAEHDRGHLHSAWFKDAMLDRFYAICNCCKCCCAGIEAMVKHGVPSLASSGFVAHVDETVCAACATCQESCPFDAIQVNGTAIVNWEACMGCGVCVGQCPNNAMSLVRDGRKGMPLDVQLLAREQAGPLQGSA